MADEFLELGPKARAAVLRRVGQDIGRAATVLEKDVFLCWTLKALFTMPDAPKMAFKGGTSLSKVYKAIDRFSEDVDITIDHQWLSPEFDPFSAALSNTRVPVLLVLKLAFSNINKINGLHAFFEKYSIRTIS